MGVPASDMLVNRSNSGAFFSRRPEVASQRSRIIWTGDWWPHPLSDTYHIQISYTLGRRPRIAILSPKLKLAPGKTRLPHVYPDGQMDICVHRPEEWMPSSLIADTAFSVAG
jgi:hypothetical protein